MAMTMNHEELFRCYPEARTEVVGLLCRGVTVRQISEALGVSRQCVYNWSKREREIEMMKRDPVFKSTMSMLEAVLDEVSEHPPHTRAEERRRRQKILKTSPELRAKVVRLVELGYGVTELAGKLGVTTPAIAYWKSQVDGIGIDSVQASSDLEELRGIVKSLIGERG